MAKKTAVKSKPPAPKSEVEVSEPGPTLPHMEWDNWFEPFGWVGDRFDQFQPWMGRFLPEAIRGPIAGAAGIRVEQFRENGDVVVRAEIPGVDPSEDIEVSVEGDRLTISGERKRSEEAKTDGGFRSEFHYGSFRRVTTLPAGASAENVEASYDDGILEVRVHIDEEAEAKTKVPVQRKG